MITCGMNLSKNLKRVNLLTDMVLDNSNRESVSDGSDGSDKLGKYLIINNKVVIVMSESVGNVSEPSESMEYGLSESVLEIRHVSETKSALAVSETQCRNRRNERNEIRTSKISLDWVVLAFGLEMLQELNQNIINLRNTARRVA